MTSHNLEETARRLVAPGKGLLAADESFGTIEKRFQSINVPSTEDNRRAYRELLFSTPGLGAFISGVILFDETIRQSTAGGVPFVELLRRQGIIPGIKVDKGAKTMANFPGEKITEGLDGLRDRFKEYFDLGARFSKWRAVITIGAGIPTRACLEANAHALARYAALSQETGLVPVVEPEVLMDGTHTIEQCAEVTERTQRIVFEALHEQRVAFEKMILKPNMVLPATDCPQQADPHQVAAATIRCLRRTVPAAVPGIAFLSGGQDDITATRNLEAINELGPHPWRITFSYSRALENAPLKTWGGNPANVAAAQTALHHRAQFNSAAQLAQYSAELETTPA